MKTYQLTLPDEFATLADQLLTGKRFENFDALVMAALWALDEQCRWEDGLDPEGLREQIREGIEQADRGETAPLDAGVLQARVQERLAENRESAHAGGDTDRPS